MRHVARMRLRRREHMYDVTLRDVQCHIGIMSKTSWSATRPMLSHRQTITQHCIILVFCAIRKVFDTQTLRIAQNTSLMQCCVTVCVNALVVLLTSSFHVANDV